MATLVTGIEFNREKSEVAFVARLDGVVISRLTYSSTTSRLTGAALDEVTIPVANFVANIRDLLIFALMIDREFKTQVVPSLRLQVSGYSPPAGVIRRDVRRLGNGRVHAKFEIGAFSYAYRFDSSTMAVTISHGVVDFDLNTISWWLWYLIDLTWLAGASSPPL